jgi:putative ABC transport system permease protein
MKNNYRIEKNHRPPRQVRKLLQWLCPPELYESIEGDLLEEFDKDCQEVGERKARQRFIWNAIRFVRPGILLRNHFSIQSNNTYMLQNYLKVMLRNLVKRKVHAAINIVGLTVGLTFAMLIGVFVWQEFNVNRQLKDVDRLFILEQNRDNLSGVKFFAPADLAKTMKEQYPNKIENYYRFWDRNIKVSKDDKHFIIQSIVGDSTFLTMFGFPVLHGDAASALTQPYAMVITEKIALQFFNKTDVVGETLTISSGSAEKKEYMIKAVVPALRRNSVSDLVNIDAQIFLTIKNAPDLRLPDPQGWDQGMVCYLKTGPNTSQAEAEQIMKTTIQHHAPENVRSQLSMALSPLSDYYLLTNNGAAKKMVVILSTIAGFILLLASINFVNISIGSASVRLKEIGVRKVIGGLRKQLVFQFLTESLFLTFVSGAISIVLYEILRPSIEGLFSTTLFSVWKLDSIFWKWSVVLLSFIGLCAGIYPAFFMSSYKIVESLKGKVKHSRTNVSLPKALVTIQFLIAICIFIAAIAVTQQVSYFLKKDLGYDKSFVLTISSVPRIWTEEGVNRMNTAKQEFLATPEVESVSLSWEIPNGNAGGNVLIYKDGTNQEGAILMPLLKTDEDYHKVYGLTVTDGDFFYPDNASWRPNSIVINKKAQEALQVSVGDRVRMKDGGEVVFTIRGIVRDFHFNSLHEEVKPLAILHAKELNMYRFFSMKIRPGSISESISVVEGLWKKLFPDDPFDYAFMEDQLAKLYKTEVQLRKASAVATILMLIIVLTGMVGVVSLSVSRRAKEIGIRKVLGASVSNILMMISKEYALLSLTAFMIGAPLAYYFVNEWLGGFPYHIGLQWWMFVMPGLFTLCVTVLVVGWQSLKTALLNPTKTLKYE